jgi:hypothetical protein
MHGSDDVWAKRLHLATHILAVPLYISAVVALVVGDPESKAHKALMWLFLITFITHLCSIVTMCCDCAIAYYALHASRFLAVFFMAIASGAMVKENKYGTVAHSSSSSALVFSALYMITDVMTLVRMRWIDDECVA